MAQSSKKPGNAKRTSRVRPTDQAESGQPGGGRGRTDKVGRTGVYPGAGPFPAGEADVKTPESFVHGQRDEEGREVEGGSEISFISGKVVGGETPSSSSPAKKRPGAGGPKGSSRKR